MCLPTLGDLKGIYKSFKCSQGDVNWVKKYVKRT